MAQTKIYGYLLSLKIGNKLILGLETTGLKIKANFEELLLKEHGGIAADDFIDFDTEMSISGKTIERDSSQESTHEDFETLREAVATEAEIAFVYGRFVVGEKIISGTLTLRDWGEDAGSKKELANWSGSAKAKKGSVVFTNYSPNVPTGLTLSLISGGVKIDWTDTNAATAETEIWGRSDDGTSALLYTITAGVVTKNDLLAPVDLRYYKIRSLRGGAYSAFSTELSIAMLGAEMITSGWNTAGLTWWNTHDATWTGDGSKVIADGAGGSLVKNTSIVTTKTYLVKSTCLVTSGYYRLYDGSDYTGSDVCSSTGSYSKNYTPIYNGFINIYSWSFLGSITALSVKEILFP